MAKAKVKHSHLGNKFLLFLASLFVAYYIFSTDAVEQFLHIAKEWELLGVFIVGAMFTSMFTVIPATIILGELAVYEPLATIVIVGALGAALADCFILYFFENQIHLHLANSKDRGRYRRMRAFFNAPGMHTLGLIAGSILIILPLPDELGLALMGITNVKIIRFFPIAFVSNMIGIYLVGMAARALV